MMDWFLYGDFGSAPANWPSIIMGLLVALACGQVLAWVYMLTHSGLSYSRSFVNAMLLLPSIVSLVMMVLSNNLVTAFGMMAVFAIVRFRNILRDTLDTAYILTALVIGMAAGTQKYASAGRDGVRAGDGGSALPLVHRLRHPPPSSTPRLA